MFLKSNQYRIIILSFVYTIIISRITANDKSYHNDNNNSGQCDYEADCKEAKTLAEKYTVFKSYTVEVNPQTVNANNEKNTVDAIKNNGKRRLKILIHSPGYGWSHVQFQAAIADILVEAGHEVHLLTYTMLLSTGNYTGNSKAQKIIRHYRPHDKLLKHEDQFDDLFNGPQYSSWIEPMREIIDYLLETCREMIRNEELLEFLRSERYDFAISETYTTCAFGIFKMIGVRSTAVTQALDYSATINSFLGLPSFSSFVHDLFVSEPSNPLEMNVFQRLVNFVYDVVLRVRLRNYALQVEQPIFDEELGAQAPSLRVALRNVSVVFLNSDEFIAPPRPTSAKIIHIGGIAAKSSMNLTISEPFASIFAKARKGVVLFSLGTLVNTRNMDASLRDSFLRAFAAFSDYEFIWKYSAPTGVVVRLPENVHVFDWIPQRALLADSRTKAFISHCGLNSASEAARAGVPILSMPIFFDQPHTASALVKRGISIPINIGAVRRQGAGVVRTALQQLLAENTSYARNAKILAQKLAIAPFTARDKLVRWVEFAAQFDDFNELNLPIAEEFGFFAYYSLDIIIMLLAALLLSVLMLFKILCFLKKYVKNK